VPRVQTVFFARCDGGSTSPDDVVESFSVERPSASADLASRLPGAATGKCGPLVRDRPVERVSASAFGAPTDGNRISPRRRCRVLSRSGDGQQPGASAAPHEPGEQQPAAGNLGGHYGGGEPDLVPAVCRWNPLREESATGGGRVGGRSATCVPALRRRRTLHSFAGRMPLSARSGWHWLEVKVVRVKYGAVRART